MATPRNTNDLLKDAVSRQRGGDIEGARELLTEATRQTPDNVDMRVLLGNLEVLDKNFRAAEKHYRKALELDPKRTAVHHALGELLFRLGDFHAAEGSLTKAIQMDPGNPAYGLSLARTLNAQARWGESARQLRDVVQKDPGNANAWLCLGAALHGQGGYGSAAECYQRAVGIAPDFAAAHASLGKVMTDSGHHQEAERSYSAALAIEPGNPLALAGLALLANLDGRYTEALDLLEPVVKEPNVSPQILVIYTRLKRRIGEHQQAIEVLANVLRSASTKLVAVDARFCLGDIHDDLGEYDKAFAYYREANAMRLAEFSAKVHREQVDSLMAFFSSENLSKLAVSGAHTKKPVFIVGMPRSGTSLVEQILSSHPLVLAGGERAEIHHLRAGLKDALGSSRDYPDCLLDADTKALREAAEGYLRSVAGDDDTALRITDKLPTNFLNLGLIQIVFPSARIVHCVRNPLDTALSCYFQNFGHQLPFSQDLADIAEYYADYRRIMGHWKSVMSLPILDVCYESLVEDQEGVSRKLLDFIGLPWDDRCLEFYGHDRIVITASYAQVKEPIYSRSVDRHRNYEKHLGKLKERLKEYL